MKNFVTVITPAYNAERFIAETIKSVQNQTHTDWEHLVVIDCNSKDRTEQIVSEISRFDARVKCIKSPKALGAAQNRNVGLTLAKGDLVAFIDADDLWTPEKLAKQIELMNKPDVHFCYTAFTRISEDSQSLGSFLSVPEKMDYRFLLKQTRIGCLTVMIRRSAFSGVEFQNKGWEDLSLWLKLLKQVTYAYGINESLALYRIVQGSRSNNKIFSAGLTWETLRDVEKMNLFKASYYFSLYALSGLKKHKQF
jgi:teichuronic acid biosynthesis glycosyltransferase TuaG